MKTITNLILILVASPAFGEDEVCKNIQSGSIELCSISETITKITVLHPNNTDTLTLDFAEFPGNWKISPYALNKLHITTLWITGATETSLSLLPDAFAGIPKLQNLLLSSISVEFLSNPLIPLESLTQLIYDNIKLTEVPIEMLASPRLLEHLELTKNQISAIRSNSFASRRNLRILQLSDNGITYIEKGAFNGLSKLENLDLARNDFLAFPGIFQGMPALKELNLDGALAYDKCSLPFGIFDGLSELVTLTLGSNRLEYVPVGIFDNLTSLTTLDLWDNMIEEITPGAFGRAISGRLTLDSNAIQAIKPDTFKDLKVNVLSLRDNRINELQPRAFDGLALAELNLAGNLLEKIKSIDFQGLNTSELNLYHNIIKNIDRGALRNVVMDKGVVNLDLNPLSRAPTAAELGLPDSVELIL